MKRSVPLNASVQSSARTRLALLFLGLIAAALSLHDAWAEGVRLVEPGPVSLSVADKSAIAIADPSASLSPDAAKSRLESNPSDQLRSGECPATTCWMMFTVSSDLVRERDVSVEYAEWARVDLWVYRDGRPPEHLPAGGAYSFSTDRNPIAPPGFFLNPGESVTVLLRLQMKGSWDSYRNQLSVDLWPGAGFFLMKEPLLVSWSLVFGAMLSIGLYNLIIAVSTRSRSYFWYCGYLLFMSVGFIAVRIPEHLLANHGQVLDWLAHTSDYLMWVCLIFFTRSFLLTRVALPRLDKIYWVLLTMLGLGWISGAFDTRYWVAFSYVGWCLPGVFGMVIAIARLRQGFKPARYFSVAQAVLCVGMLVETGSDNGWFVMPHFAGSGMLTALIGDPLWPASVIEALIFSLALADRLKSLQSTLTNQTMQHLRDRDMLITEQRRQLEVEVAERTEDLALQMSRSDELLHNVLPVEIAAELKLSGASLPRRFDNVSILFTDFVGFTTVVSSLPPQRLVEEINDMFKSFDDILAEVGVEKIKTIGDSYMIASGLPETVEDHAERCVVAAQRMFAYLEERNQSAPIKWNMRAGIHSGAVVAGIVGKHKFAYDVFGDTVNIASRMESAGSPGRINISAYTYDLIRHRFTTTYRGKINAKGKGEIDMYFVEAAVEQPAAS